MANQDSTEHPEEEELETRTLTVIIHSISGFKFLTELGQQQVAASILFPIHQNDSISPLFPPSETIDFNFSVDYHMTIYPQSTFNALLSNPLEFLIYVATPDFKKQAQIAKFSLSFDDIIMNQSFTSLVEGSVLNEGQNVLSGEELRAQIECKWDVPLIDSTAVQQSCIASINIGSLTALPQQLSNCIATPNNYQSHVFSYSLIGELPDGQKISLDDGKFTSTMADGSDGSIVFGVNQKFFINPDGFQKWKENAENEQFISLYLIPEILPAYTSVGVVSEQYGSLYAKADFPLSYFLKPGRSHFLSTIQLIKDSTWVGVEKPVVTIGPNGFPPDIVPESGTKKNNQLENLHQPNQNQHLQNQSPCTLR